MKKLPLKNPSYRFLEQSFKEWLDVLGYAPSSVYQMPLYVRELLYYLEQINVKHIRELDIHHINQHYENLHERTNQRRAGGLSGSHLNKHIQALQKFTDYLRKMGRIQLPALKLSHEDDKHTITFLTEEEMQLLIQVTLQSVDPLMRISVEKEEALQSRDRAMIAVFYGCGLRRNEGVHLNLSDINFDRSILHVRKGKNYKERLVPIGKTSREYLKEYIYDYRPRLSQSSLDALFLSYRGFRMQGQSLLIRLKRLQLKSGNPALLEKDIGLHTLRHSIATHLMAAGMSIDGISRFLGHSTLESTQIYTHLAGVANG
jgi:integrase/recombinase XerD